MGGPAGELKIDSSVVKEAVENLSLEATDRLLEFTQKQFRLHQQRQAEEQQAHLNESQIQAQVKGFWEVVTPRPAGACSSANESAAQLAASARAPVEQRRVVGGHAGQLKINSLVVEEAVENLSLAATDRLLAFLSDVSL